MKLKIEINLDNAAFENAAAREVERILDGLIERLSDSPDGSLQRDTINLRDINGNHVGTAKITR